MKYTMDICGTGAMCRANCGTEYQMLRLRVVISDKDKTQPAMSGETRQAEHK